MVGLGWIASGGEPQLVEGNHEEIEVGTCFIIIWWISGIPY